MRIQALFLVCCFGCVGVTAVANQPELLGRVNAGASPDTAQSVKLWNDMDARERAELWPFLDPVTRSIHWRDMTKAEREAIRQHLTAAEKEKIRRRYCFTGDDSRAHAPRDPGLDRMQEKDRSLMRQQIMEVHIELFSNSANAGGHAHHLRGGEPLGTPPAMLGGDPHR